MGRNQTFPRLKGYQASSGCLERHIVWRLFSERAEGVPSPFLAYSTSLHFHIREVVLMSIPKFSRSSESPDAVIVDMRTRFFM